MAKAKKRPKRPVAGRPERAKLTGDESLKRMQEFAKRKERFIAAVRTDKD